MENLIALAASQAIELGKLRLLNRKQAEEISLLNEELDGMETGEIDQTTFDELQNLRDEVWYWKQCVEELKRDKQIIFIKKIKNLGFYIKLKKNLMDVAINGEF